MDSLSQIVLGGAVAAAIAPAGHRRAALLAGAALGTVPDLDGLLIAAFSDNPVTLMTVHRSFSHSLFVLPLLGTLVWWLFRRFGHGRVAQAPARWWWAIVLALVTHPLLDAFTVYGTQLWWPLTPSPTMWSSVFIIDPLYTVWLALACAVAWFARARPLAQRALAAGLVLSSGYLGWSLLAKGMVEREAERALVAMGLGDAPRFSVPMPFNTLLWRVVAMTPSGYVVGDRSLWADHGPMRFQGHPSNVQALRQAAQIPVVARLQWFNRGFMRAQVQDGTLVLSDLRMGLEPDYNFNFAVARAEGEGWKEMAPEQLRPAYREQGGRELLAQRLQGMWQRIWTMPAQDHPAAAPENRVALPEAGQPPRG
ncbi:metal-dependent hydrolase [Flavobacterium sp. MXW15]|uniref:Metal-dependent hydrolase n=1 Tax=Xanthomonas chitinilytica TaxID=2989819 RepID=A0ABT3JSB2_9XANT|nr:metal-dependent hydrolase [Xanthomonas sp. H13-6]MCW4454158.1 metal-dependent hydrolase [Flavobacterium sp. MXW15]MCW4471392.1 metal-dependent hydrolase [Xanthomonas sp. H13-6]